MTDASEHLEDGMVMSVGDSTGSVDDEAISAADDTSNAPALPLTVLLQAVPGRDLLT